MNKKLKGFTLIELLIVMAILGVLAVVVLVAINPVQQLARTRDTGRKSTVAQLGRSLEAYYTAHSGSYVTESVTWIATLSTSGELSTIPSRINYRGGFTPVTCGTAQSGWCYDVTAVGGPVLVFAELESDSDISKCPVSGSKAYFVWSTADGRGGTVCTSGALPTPGTQTFVD